MQFNDYSTKAISTLTDKDSHKYGDVDARLMAQILGLSGESGEVMEKFKKILRDKNGEISENDRDAIIKELGDVLWYVNSIGQACQSSLLRLFLAINYRLIRQNELLLCRYFWQVDVVLKLANLDFP